MKLYDRLFRRLVVLCLAVCLTTGIVWPGGMGDITAHAATEQSPEEPPKTELPNDNLGDGAGEDLAYKSRFQTEGGGWEPRGGASIRADMKGLGAGETTYDNASINYFMSNRGVPTYLFMGAKPTPYQVKKLGEKSKFDPTVLQNETFYAAKLGQRDEKGDMLWPSGAPVPGADKVYNGAVDRLTIGGITAVGEDKPVPEQMVEGVTLETRVTTTPTPDGKYILVDYYIQHVGGTMPADGRTFWLGSQMEWEWGKPMIGGGSKYLMNDAYKTDNGFYAISPEDNTTMTVVTKDSRLGISEHPTNRWMGDSADGFMNIMTDGTKDELFNAYAGIAYSWEFQLKPYELIHKRIAIAAKETAYYVSAARGVDAPADQSGSGTFKAPFKTLEHAVNQCNGKNAYIYVQDYGPISAAIDLVPEGFAPETSVTIASSDVNQVGESMMGKDNYIQVLRRAEGYTGPLFTQTRDAVVQFDDITLDGGREALDTLTEASQPLITSTTGTLKLSNALTLQNNVGGAVRVTGDGSLSMNGAGGETKITGNLSGRGAVDFDSTGEYTVNHHVTVQGNEKPGGTAEAPKAAANVYLAENMKILVDGDLDASSIGVTTAKTPKTSPEGNVTEAEQEIVIAAPSDQYPDAGDYCLFAANFSADSSEEGLYTTTGTANIGGKRNTVMRMSGYTINFTYLDGNNISIGGEDLPRAESYAPGAEVNIASPAIEEYILDDVETDPGEIDSLTVGADGSITGTMPSHYVRVTYRFKDVVSSFTFEPNGGTPQPVPITGKPGVPVHGIFPTVSRIGYIFDGWTLEPGGSIEPSLPATYPDPAAEIKYYARYSPSEALKFDYTEVYESVADSTGSSFQFGTTTETDKYHAEEAIIRPAAELQVPGYLLDTSNSSTLPATYRYADGVEGSPMGTFSDSGFNGKMPAQEAIVTYRYQVNTDVRFPLTVKHVTANGTVAKPTTVTQHYAEEEITTQPYDTYDFRCIGARVDAGDAANSAGGLVSVLERPAIFPHESSFVGEMPNQPVTITYTYEAKDFKYPLAVNYLDNGTDDEDLKDIKIMEPHLHKPEDEVGISCVIEPVFYLQPYGYALTGKSMEPAAAGIVWDGNDFDGVMPTEKLDIIYEHNRIPAHWADITYKVHPEALGQLKIGDGTSSDVQANADGTFTASVLFSDGSAQGQSEAYTLGKVMEKQLTPEAVGDTAYQFGGWFVDTNGDGKLGVGEILLSEDYLFTGPMTLTAHFEKDPAWWMDVFFEAGEHGSIRAGESLSKNVRVDTIWGNIGALPVCDPETNYMLGKWYQGDTPMENTTRLIRNRVYTARFIPDPRIFGTDVKLPDAVPGIDHNGKGRITVFNATEGYNYMLTDLEGIILETVPGNSMTERAIFTKRLPGTRYKVYEVDKRLARDVGSSINDIAGSISVPAEVLIPVVESNYQVYSDEKQEGKTRLLIKPADAEADYALLDSQGKVVLTPETQADGFKTPSGSPASVSISGLEYNQEYTVVARPRGRTDISAPDKKADGTVITTDPGGELELSDYIVETVGGEIVNVGETAVAGELYEEAHKDDMVTLTAEPLNDEGQAFSHWEFLIGSVKDLENEVRQREFSFVMPDTNLVLAAVYEPSVASPANARMAGDEVRGGNSNEMALDSREVQVLGRQLTTNEDRELIAVNRADVTYKAVYRKNSVKTEEADAVRSSDDYIPGHENAFKAAWGLDVSLERYVNGRKIDTATPSDAEFNTYVQLEKDDVDMMDYQLYKLTEDLDGALIAQEVPIMYQLDSGSMDPEEGIVEQTGGLFTFQAEAGARYVMVYSRAYRLYFINNMAPDDSESYRYRYHFKVRREESPEEYTKYEGVAQQHPHFVGFDGTEYNYKGWSLREDKLREFDPSGKITRKTQVYAFYTNNAKEVSDARDEMEGVIDEAVKMRDDHFLTMGESEDVRNIINDFLQVLDKVNPKATAGELKDAVNAMEEQLAPYRKKLENRYDHYDDLQNGNNSGGSGGGGGGGRGTMKEPYNPKSPNTYEVGTNGNWEEVSTGEGQKKQWVFVLNGGKRLSNIWAKLKHGEGTVPADGWYHFNRDGVMETGWIRDEQGGWYYCSQENEGTAGKMATGWRKDSGDGRWYHLDAQSGAMAVGWRQVDGTWYYFETVGGTAERPMGSMHQNGTTPDGYQVDANGAWIP